MTFLCVLCILTLQQHETQSDKKENKCSYCVSTCHDHPICPILGLNTGVGEEGPTFRIKVPSFVVLPDSELWILTFVFESKTAHLFWQLLFLMCEILLCGILLLSDFAAEISPLREKKQSCSVLFFVAFSGFFFYFPATLGDIST